MSKTTQLAARRAAEREAAARRREQARRRARLWAGGSIGAVVLLIVVLVIVKVAGGGSSTPPSPASAADSARVVAAVTAVPTATLDSVGRGTVDALPKAISGQPALTSAGKPLVVYIGAEYCPFCAAQRWGLVVALSRFGQFTGLTTSTSASDDVFPNTATLSFHGATYTSDHLVFQGVETQSNVRQGNGYAPLDTLTSQQGELIEKYNAPPYVSADSAGAIPFIDLGNRYLSSGASLSPQLLAGKNAEQIAQALSNPDDPIAKAVLGSANAFTTALCQLTNQQPAAVCSGTAALAYKGALGAG